MKLSKHLCLACSTCAMFFNSSFTVSIIARFLSSSLSDTLIMAPFMLFLSLVISCMPSTNRRWKRFLLIYPLFPTSLPYMNSTKGQMFLPFFSYVYARGVKFYRTAINFIRCKDSYKILINIGKEWEMPKFSKGFWRKVPKFSKVCTLFMPKISVPTNQTIHSLGLLYPLFLHQCDLN